MIPWIESLDSTYIIVYQVNGYDFYIQIQIRAENYLEKPNLLVDGLIIFALIVILRSVMPQ